MPQGNIPLKKVVCNECCDHSQSYNPEVHCILLSTVVGCVLAKVNITPYTDMRDIKQSFGP